MTLKYKGFESLDFHIKSNVTRKSFIIAKQCSFWYKLPKRRVIASRSLNILFLNQMKVPFHASEQEFKQMLERGTNHPVTWKHFTGLKIRKSHSPPAILHWAFLLQTDGCFWIFLGQEHLHKKCIYSCFLLKMTMQKFKMKWIILELCRRHRKILPLPLHWSIWTQNVLSRVGSWDVSWGIVKDPQTVPQDHGGASALCTVTRAHTSQGQGRKGGAV